MCRRRLDFLLQVSLQNWQPTLVRDWENPEDMAAAWWE